MTYEKREWAKGDPHPGANDLNRIEAGIEKAHQKIDAMANDGVALPVQTGKALIIERVRSLPKLADNAKAADITKAFNDLLSALQGSDPVDEKDGGE